MRVGSLFAQIGGMDPADYGPLPQRCRSVSDSHCGTARSPDSQRCQARISTPAVRAARPWVNPSCSRHFSRSSGAGILILQRHDQPASACSSRSTSPAALCRWHGLRAGTRSFRTWSPTCGHGSRSSSVGSVGWLCVGLHKQCTTNGRDAQGVRGLGAKPDGRTTRYVA